MQSPCSLLLRSADPLESVGIKRAYCREDVNPSPNRPESNPVHHVDLRTSASRLHAEIRHEEDRPELAAG